MVDASTRSSGVTNKASFLAVCAGVLITAATTQLWESAPGYGVASFALSCLALACAAVALLPGKRPGIEARRLVDRHFECDHSGAQVEAEIVRDKETVPNCDRTRHRQPRTLVWAGFGVLAVAALSLATVFSFELLGG